MGAPQSDRNAYLVAHVDTEQGRARIRLRGDLDACSTAIFLRAVETVPADTATVVVDLTDLDFIDAGGIRSLVEATTRRRSWGGSLVVARPSPTAARLFAIADVDLTLDITSDPDQS